MTHHITADRLVESAIKAVTEELFRDFDNTLRSLCDGEDDRKAVFRTLRYAHIRLHVLCGYISKEETPESRTYFLDKMRERLNLRMQRDDEKERERRR